jgi:hypothetical protein
MQVLLDLTVHQEQIISLFHHQILMSARQRLLQQQQQQQQVGPEAATTTAFAAVAGAVAADGEQLTPLEPQQQLQRLHQQLLQQVEQVQQQHGLQETLQTSCSWSADTADAMEEDVHHQQALEAQQQQQQQQKQPDVDTSHLGIEDEDELQQHLQQQHLQQQQSHPASCSYVGALLQAAATDEAAQQRVLAMTTPDWSKFFTESFHKLLLLLELADRSEEFLQADQPQQQRQLERQQPAGSGRVIEKRPARHSSSAGEAADIQQQQGLMRRPVLLQLQLLVLTFILAATCSSWSISWMSG